MEIAVVSHVLRGEDPRLCHVHPAAPRMGLRAEVDDRHHERCLRVSGHHHVDFQLVAVLLREVRLNDEVTVPERLQAAPVAVPLPLGDRVMSHVKLAVLSECRPQVAEATLFWNGLVGELLGLDLPICRCRHSYHVFEHLPPDLLLRLLQPCACWDSLSPPEPTLSALEGTALRFSPHTPDVIFLVSNAQLHLWTSDRIRKSAQVLPSLLPSAAAVQAAPAALAFPVAGHVDVAQRLNV